MSVQVFGKRPVSFHQGAFISGCFNGVAAGDASPFGIPPLLCSGMKINKSSYFCRYCRCKLIAFLQNIWLLTLQILEPGQLKVKRFGICDGELHFPLFKA